MNRVENKDCLKNDLRIFNSILKPIDQNFKKENNP